MRDFSLWETTFQGPVFHSTMFNWLPTRDHSFWETTFGWQIGWSLKRSFTVLHPRREAWADQFPRITLYCPVQWPTYIFPRTSHCNPFIPELIFIYVVIPFIHRSRKQTENGWSRHMVESHSLLQFGASFIQIEPLKALPKSPWIHNIQGSVLTFSMLSYHSWDTHLSVHLLWQQVHTSEDISTNNDIPVNSSEMRTPLTLTCDLDLWPSVTKSKI